jgi:hypothetical protein
MLELSNFKKAHKTDFSSGRQTWENLKSGLPDHSEAQESLKLFCGQFALYTESFVDDK